jgi:hypothetical protein
MKNWQTETSIYIPRLEMALRTIAIWPPTPTNIPHPPLEAAPSLSQSVIHRAVTFYELGIWCRAGETMEAIISLWREGYLSSSAALSRLIFELWCASHFMSENLKVYSQHKDISKLGQVVDKLFEGVRSEVLLPWGAPASEKPIHVLDTIRSISHIFPNAMSVYETLCESAHANQPRFMEWWCLGKTGDNWTNETVQARGHALIDATIDVLEKATIGIKTDTEIGMKFCGELY